MTVLGESKKHLILMSQHHWSPTASHPPHPPHAPLLHPALPLLSYAFCPPCCFWKFKKVGKRVIICITNTCFLRFKMKIASPQRPTEALYLTVNKKIKTQFQTMKNLLRIVSNRLQINRK